MSQLDMLTCTLYSNSCSYHLSQIYTGFYLLEANGVTKLQEKNNVDASSGELPITINNPYGFHGAFARVDDKLIFFDLKDAEDLYENLLGEVDFYFKRGFNPRKVPAEYMASTYPLGLNYEIYFHRFKFYQLLRELQRYQVEGNVISGMIRKLFLPFAPDTTNMYKSPDVSQASKVLFMTRTWDPDNDPPDLSEVEKEGRFLINEMRARVIRLLRKELGEDFFGGFQKDAYSSKTYPDCIIDNSHIVKKRNYLKFMSEHPICVATRGLHNSIGWKMGEYVAFSRSIVSEEFSISVEGLQEGTHYLSASNADGICENVILLNRDKDKREQMMIENWDFYRTYLSPDKLIERALARVVDVEGGGMGMNNKVKK